MKIHLTFMGRSYHAAEPLPAELEIPDSGDLEAALQILQESPGGNMLPSSCLLAVSGEHLGTLADHPDHVLKEGDELTLIAPVAGG